MLVALIYSNVKNLTKYTEEHQMQKRYTISMTFSMFLQLNRRTLSFSERKRRSGRTNKKRLQEQQRWLSHDRSQGWYSRTTWAMQSRRSPHRAESTSSSEVLPEWIMSSAGVEKCRKTTFVIFLIVLAVNIYLKTFFYDMNIYTP